MEQMKNASGNQLVNNIPIKKSPLLLKKSERQTLQQKPNEKFWNIFGIS